MKTKWNTRRPVDGPHAGLKPFDGLLCAMERTARWTRRTWTGFTCGGWNILQWEALPSVIRWGAKLGDIRDTGGGGRGRGRRGYLRCDAFLLSLARLEEKAAGGRAHLQVLKYGLPGE